MNQDKTIEEVLNFDPIAQAEKDIGKSTSDDDVFLLALDYQMSKSQMLKNIMSKRKDVYYSMDLSKFIDVITNYGFVKQHHMHFQSDYGEELFGLYWHPDGLLLRFDSYRNQGIVNDGRVYYNWTPHNVSNTFNVISSGCFVVHDDDNKKYVWSGEHHVSDGLLYKLERLRNNGRFLQKWVEAPFLWLLHHIDSKQKGYDYEAINTERLKLLNAEVCNMINESRRKK